MLADDKANSNIEQPTTKEPYKCKACLVLGYPDFKSLDDEIITKHILKQIGTSTNIVVSELSLDKSNFFDINEGFD